MADALTDFLDAAADKVAQIRQEQQRKEDEETAQRERLITILRDSRFTEITNALRDLPEKNGRTFRADGIDWADIADDNGRFERVVTLGKAGRYKAGASDTYKESGRPRATLSFQINVETGAVLATRYDHIVVTEEGKHRAEEIKYPDMTQAVKEQLADWLASVAPDRVEELKQQRAAPKPVAEPIPTPEPVAAPVAVAAPIAPVVRQKGLRAHLHTRY